MKTKLLTILLLISITIINSQTIVNLNPSQSINDTVLYYSNNFPDDDVIFNLQPGTYTETDGITFPYGGSSRYTLQSADGNPNNVIIESDNTNSLLIERGYVTIKDITINSTYSVNSQSTITIYSDNYLDSVIIENCIINAETANYDKAIDIMGGYGDYTNIYIRNCDINNGNDGIYSYGIGMGVLKDNINIINNNFTNQTENSISISEVTNLKIINNNIQLPNTGSQPGNTAKGLDLYSTYSDPNYSDGITNISGNKIYKETTENIAYTAISLIQYDLIYNGGSFIISNNIIDINTDTLAIGFYTENTSHINFYHNSLRINGDNNSKCFANNGTNEFTQIKNNIFESTGYSFFGDFSQASTIDYNNYFGVDTMFYNTNSSTALTLSDWIVSTSFDQNSTTFNPNFGSTITDLSLNNHLLNNIASITSVIYDIDSVVRNTPMCDMGAKEIAYANLGNDTTLCFGSTLTLDGGAGYYSYLWNTGATTPTINVNAAGQYIVTIEEVQGGATATDTINVVGLPELQISFNTQEPNCYTSTDGYAVVSIINGTTPINYNWAGSYDGDGTDSLYNIGLGTYYLTVTDVNLCTSESQIFINAPTQLSLSFDTIEFCGGCIGELTANAFGGTGAYSYNWSNLETTQHIMDLCTGTYVLTITDDNNCIFTDSVDITEGPLGYLAGTVDYSGGNFNANEIKVELYKQYTDGAFHVEQVDENLIDGTSKFEFTGVYPYQYTFRGIVEQGTYNNVASSYYGNTVDWYNATYLTIGCGDTINDIDFTMYEIPQLAGAGTFNGTVTYESSNKSINLAGEPVSGAEIYLEQDPSDEPIANTNTDVDGDWEIDSIQEGTGYNLRVDIPGLDQISTYENLYITPNDTLQTNLNFLVDTTSGGGISTDTAFSSIVMKNQTINIKVYPNPASDYISFETSLSTAGDIKFDIIDIKGEVVYTSEEIKGFVGEFNKHIDISKYEEGTYLLKFKIDNNYYLKKIIKQ